MKPTFKATNAQFEATKLLINDVPQTLLYGGSRSGKTFILLREVLKRAALAPETTHAIFRFRFNHARETIWLKSLRDVVRICSPGIIKKYYEASFYAELHNGSRIWIGGLDEKERVEKILGNEYSTIYLNEASQISYGAYTTAVTRLSENKGLDLKFFIDCNPPTKGHWIYRLFIEGVNPISRAPVKTERYQHKLMNPADNRENLQAMYFDELEALPPRQRARFLYGQFLDDVVGALFSQEWIDTNRVTEVPDDTRNVIGLDPAVTAGENADENGIVVFGHNDGMGYVLEDASLRASPTEWGRRVVQLYHEYECECVVAEVNNGGDMIKTILKAIDPTVRVQEVRATKGKRTRAEPISALYEQGLIHHVNELYELEEQMTTYTGEPGQKSPDRMDALVWAATYTLTKKPAVPRIRSL